MTCPWAFAERTTGTGCEEWFYAALVVLISVDRRALHGLQCVEHLCRPHRHHPRVPVFHTV